MDDVRAEPTDQVDPLGSARQHRLRADVDAEPRDLCGAQLAAHLGRGLQHEHVAPGVGQAASRDQSGHAATDHDHVPRHSVSLG